MQPTMKPVKLVLDEETHRLFRVAAARRGLPMSHLAVKLVEDLIGKDHPGFKAQRSAEKLGVGA